VTVIQAAWLGVVQGLTEFLPISSSAHLILTRELLGWEAGPVEIPFDVACHLGTLLSVLLYFRSDLVEMVRATPEVLTGAPGEPAQMAQRLIVGTVPIALVGWLLAGVIDRLREPGVVVLTLSAGALVMLVAERVARLEREAASLTLFEAFGLGCAQAVALIPGVSRSGSVITVAMLRGLNRKEAARFSFLLGIPAILAAGVRSAWTVPAGALSGQATVLAVGFLASGVVGYLAVAGLIRYLAHHPIDLFAYYRLVVAAALLVWLLAS
tara:strand:- start:99 stop:902 length:804 start_codon:yes stop_codon:yes gene_type:complete